MDMKRIDINELKELQLAILDTVHKFCIEHGINYWLDCGTLLGAVRPNGYIPWDDDIDIGMLRDDYEKFRVEFNKYNDRYSFSCVEDDDTYCFAFGKVLDTNTILYEPDKNGRKIAVYIDVFVYDNAPDDEEKLKKMYQKRDFYRGCNTARTQLPDDEPGIIRKCIFWFLHYALKVFPKSFFAKKMVQNSKTYMLSETKRVGNFTSRSKFACDKQVFNTFIEHVFEGRQYMIPAGYDQWLTSFYGDYMQLPPVEKRVHSHVFEAYMIEDR